MNGRSMTEGAPWRHILRFAFPVLLGSLLQQLYNTVDTIIVGNFASEAALSAVGTTSSFTFLFLALAMGLSAGNGVVVAQHYGAGNEQEVRANASTGIVFLMALGIGAMVLGIVIARPAYQHFVNVPEDILDLTVQYFRIYAVGLVFQYGYNIFSAILRAVGDSNATLYFLLIASVANIILDLLFVAVFHWGVAGAALATDLAQAGSFIAAYIYMRKKYPVFRFRLSEYTWDFELAKQTLKVGTPISLQLIFVSLGLTLIQRAVNSVERTMPGMVASFTVGQRIEMYLNLPGMAFQTTLATYTGQNIGAGKVDRVKKGVRQTSVITLLFTICISIFVWSMAGRIIHLFGISEQAAVYCSAHLKVIALINIVLSLYMPLFGVFQGANHGSIPMITAMSALSLRVAVTYLFCDSSIFGHTILWWNGIFGFGMGFLIAWGYYLSGRWQKNAAVAKKGRDYVQSD